MNKKKSWTYELCREEALKFNTIEEYSKKSNVSYQVVCKNGWNDSILKHLERKQHPNNYWTLEKCRSKAVKYKTKKDFKNNDPKAFSAASKNGWLNGICLHMEMLSQPSGYWTLEKCIDIAKKYDKMYKLEDGHSTAYKVICENKWNGIIKQYLINNDNIERQPS